jgi:hypothetical protein
VFVARKTTLFFESNNDAIVVVCCCCRSKSFRVETRREKNLRWEIDDDVV